MTTSHSRRESGDLPLHTQPLHNMAVVKVIEIIAEGKTIEGAIESGIKEASSSVRGIKSAWADGIQALCDAKGKISKYRVNLKLSFVVES